MDPLSAASAFATVVGLIGQFRSERSGQKQSDLNDFMQWLVETNHNELKVLLENNVKAVEGIRSTLQEDRQLFLAKFEGMNSALVSFASGISGFSTIAEAIDPNLILSKQAISILCQTEEAECSKLYESTNDGLELVFWDGKGGSAEIIEPRFIEDDLKTLVDLGLLRHDISPIGDNLYLYTRAASNLVKLIKTNS